jgi:hypothetical protein
VTWALVLAGIFVLGLAVGLRTRRGHGRLLVLGGVGGFLLWLVAVGGGRFDELEGGSAVGALLLAILVGAWSAGVSAGYLIRRIRPGSV